MAEIDTWMPWHIAEYLADTMHLSTLEHGAYLLILGHGWRNGGMIAANDAYLARVTRLPKDQWEAIKPIIERFFEAFEDPKLGKCWRQKRQVEEIEKAKAQKAKASEKSKKANDARWGSSSKHPPRSPQGVHMDSPQEGRGKDLLDLPPEENTALGNRAYVQNTLQAVDPGHLLPGLRDPPNLPATRAILEKTAKEEFWAPLCRIFGMEPRTQADEARLYDQCRDFRLKGATEAELEIRSARYRERHPSVAFTPNAVLKNWDFLRDDLPPPTKPGAAPLAKKAKAL